MLRPDKIPLKTRKKREMPVDNSLSHAILYLVKVGKGIKTAVAGNTRKLVQDDDNTKEAGSPQIKPIDLGMPRPWRIALRIVPMQIQLVFDLAGTMVIGRAQPETSTFPDIDLSPFNAEELGVSRQHLIIKLDGERVVVTDNKSSNGTKLNGERLKPNEAYPVRHGDELTLGTMALKVELLTNPIN